MTPRQRDRSACEASATTARRSEPARLPRFSTAAATRLVPSLRPGAPCSRPCAQVGFVGLDKPREPKRGGSRRAERSLWRRAKPSCSCPGPSPSGAGGPRFRSCDGLRRRLPGTTRAGACAFDGARSPRSPRPGSGSRSTVRVGACEDRNALPPLAARAHETFRPAQLSQELPARLLIRELHLELYDRPRSLRFPHRLPSSSEESLTPRRDRHGHELRQRHRHIHCFCHCAHLLSHS